jgi:hypothetical protein
VKIIIPSRTSPAGGATAPRGPATSAHAVHRHQSIRPDYHAPAPANQEGALHLHHVQAALEEVQRCTPCGQSNPHHGPGEPTASQPAPRATATSARPRGTPRTNS